MKRQTDKKPTVTGVLAVTSRGFGFVLVPDREDVFVPMENFSTAMDGDTVRAEVLREVKGRNPVGRVVEVTERASRDIVGVFRRKNGAAVVVPEDPRLKHSLRIPRGPETLGGEAPAPQEGQIVVARFERWSDPKQDPEGRILEVLGFPQDPGVELRTLAKAKQLRLDFPKAVEEQVRQIRAGDLTGEPRREDLRGVVCFTIDPETAKDFDDAVSLVQLDNGLFELGVHIADVSRYVIEGTPIDKEARERGTSVYLVQHVIPMLPERLSNDLCSLRPNQDRPAFSVFMTVDSRGGVREYRIVESLIRSRQRFTYEEVERIIGGGRHRHAKTIHLMMMLSLLLRRRREERGSIDFDTPESVISLDANGVPYEVKPSERLDAHRLIEEFMLAANHTVARHIADKSREARKAPWPFIYRVHEKPNEKDVRSLLDLLERLGIRYRVEGELGPADYRKILEIIENLEFKDLVEKVALRSMTKAVYSTENRGHFGLAFEAYTHFTSPIRRYPDLEVHRLLKRYATAGRPRSPGKLEQLLKDICEKSTSREIRAREAEREYNRLKSMQFLAGKVGESYAGVITGVTSFGLFVEITHYLIEGLVHVSEINDDRYLFDKENFRLTGRTSGRVYRLGDPVRVRIKRVSVEEGQADFAFAEPN